MDVNAVILITETTLWRIVSSVDVAVVTVKRLWKKTIILIAVAVVDTIATMMILRRTLFAAVVAVALTPVAMTMHRISLAAAAEA